MEKSYLFALFNKRGFALWYYFGTKMSCVVDSCRLAGRILCL